MEYSVLWSLNFEGTLVRSSKLFFHSPLCFFDGGGGMDFNGTTKIVNCHLSLLINDY